MPGASWSDHIIKSPTVPLQSRPDHITELLHNKHQPLAQPSNNNESKKVKDAWVPKEVKKECKLLRFLIEDRGKCGIKLKKNNDNRFFVSSLIQKFPASEAGLKASDILCKPGTMGGCLNSKYQYLKNIQIEDNRPIVVEVARILTDDDLVNGLLKKEQIKEGMLAKIHDARLEFGTVVDQLCKPEVYLTSFTYHIMATTILEKKYATRSIGITQSCVLFHDRSRSWVPHYICWGSTSVET